jgi:AraC-like DNA-binding protein
MSMRRGVSIAFHTRFLRHRYPELLGGARSSLGLWFAERECTLRDFDLPLLPVMRAATAGLLTMSMEGELRHEYVCATVQQLLCLSLAALIKKDTDKQAPIRLSPRDKAALRDVRELLTHTLADPPVVDELVRRFGINRNKLRFGFKALFGLTISDYLHQERMRQAYALLTAGELTAAEVSQVVGYNHVSNFTTAFRREFGRTPGRLSGVREH